jgi:hypothetical protein
VRRDGAAGVRGLSHFLVRTRVFHLAAEPGPRIDPVAVGGPGGDAEDLGRRFAGEPSEVAQLEQRGLDRIALSELCRRGIEREQVLVRLRRRDEVGTEFLTPMSAAVDPAAPPAGAFDRDAPHGGGRRGEEVAAPAPPPIRAVADQPQVGIVEQGRGLERLARSLAGELSRGRLAVLVMDQRQEPGRGPGLALLDRLQDAGHVAHLRRSPSIRAHAISGPPRAPLLVPFGRAVMITCVGFTSLSASKLRGKGSIPDDPPIRCGSERPATRIAHGSIPPVQVSRMPGVAGTIPEPDPEQRPPTGPIPGAHSLSCGSHPGHRWEAALALCIASLLPRGAARSWTCQTLTRDSAGVAGWNRQDGQPCARWSDDTEAIWAESQTCPHPAAQVPHDEGLAVWAAVMVHAIRRP